jgi:hypothetical protein
MTQTLYAHMNKRKKNKNKGEARGYLTNATDRLRALGMSTGH